MPGPLQHVPWTELWHPWVFTLILACQVLYLLAVGPLRERFLWGPPLPASQKLLISIGLWLIYLSEGTPLHILSEHYLFSAHMLQHVILTTIMVPLILCGIPAWAIRPLLRYRPLAAALRVLTHPAPAILCFNLIYAIWHMPIAYQSPLYNHGFHMVQHIILVVTAFMMWSPVASPVPEGRLSEPMQMLYLFFAGVIQIAVFALITYAEHPIYPFYAQAPRIWGIDPMTDQQIAGAIMKVGGMAIMLFVWGIIFYRWVGREEQQSLPSANRSELIERTQ